MDIAPALFDSPALTPGGDILVGAYDGKLYAVSTQGTMKWRFQMRPEFPIGVSVAPDGVIYAASDKLYALNGDGTKRWEASSTDGAAFAPALGSDGTIYIIGWNSVQAIRADGSTRWSGIPPRSSFGVVLASDGVIAGGFFGLNTDGVLRWQSGAGGTIYAPPALGLDGTLYIGSQNQVGAATLFALNRDGSTKWEFTTTGLLGSPIVGPDESIYFRSDAGNVCAVESTGKRRWEYDTVAPAPGFTPGTPALSAAGTLYVVAFDGRLHAIDANGQQVWHFDTSTNAFASPLIGPDGTVYFVTAKGTLYAVEGDGTGLPTTGWPMLRKDRRHTASMAGAFTTLDTPQLHATTDEFTDKIRITWPSIFGATEYNVWRGTNADSSLAVLLAEGLGGANHFDDVTAIEGQTFFYCVEAVNPAGKSPLSEPVQGRRRIAKPGELVWQFKPPTPVGLPAVSSNGTVYVSTAGGTVYALNSNGSKQWDFATGSSRTGPSLAGADGAFYFAVTSRSNLATSPREGWSVVALTAQGHRKWQFDSDFTFSLGSDQFPGLVLDRDGTLYALFTGVDSDLYPEIVALNSDGTEKWHLQDGNGFWGTPVIGADGIIYAGTTDGQLISISATGKVRWKSFVGRGFLGAGAVDAFGSVYVVLSRLFAYNPDGTQRWSFFGADSGVSPPSFGPDGTIYIGSNDGRINALNPDGSTKWSTFLGVMPSATALGSDGTVYFTAMHSISSFALNAFDNSGNRIWQFTQPLSLSVPVLGPNALVYVNSSDGALYAIRSSGGSAESAWPGYLGGSEHTGRVQIDPPTPATPLNFVASQRTSPAHINLTWTSVPSATSYDIYRSTNAEPSAAETITLDVTGRTNFNDRSAEPEVVYYYWLKARNGSGSSAFSSATQGVRRQPTPGDLFYEWTLDGIIHGSPAISGDGTIYVGVQNGTASLNLSGLYSLKPDGTTNWSKAYASWVFGSPAIGVDGSILYGAYPENLVALAPDGALRWQFDAGGPIVATPAIGHDGQIYFTAANGKFYCLSQAGKLRWSLATGGNRFSSAAVAGDGAVYFRAGESLYAVNPDGSLRWHVPTANISGTAFGQPVFSSPIVGPDARIYVGSDYSNVLAFNPDGTIRWNYVTGAPVVASPVLGLDGSVLVGADRFFSLFSTGALNWNADIGLVWATAAAASNGLTYVGTREGKFVALKPDGTIAWQADVGAPITSSPVIAQDGMIYFGADDGKLRALYGEASLARTPWPMFQHDAQHSARQEPTLPTPPLLPADLSATDGKFNNTVRVTWKSVEGAWYYVLRRGVTTNFGDSITVASNLTATVTFEDRFAEIGVDYYYWLGAGNSAGLGDFAGPVRGLRRAPIPGEKVAEVASVFDSNSSPAVAKDGAIYFGGRGRFHALNPDLSKKWDYPPDGRGFQGGIFPFSPAAVAEDGTLYFSAPDQKFYALNPDGGKKWEYSARLDANSSPALGADGTILFFNPNSGKVISLKPDGRTNWESRISTGFFGSPVWDLDDTFYFVSSERALYHANADGTVKSKLSLQRRPSASPILGPDGAVYFCTEGGNLIALNRDGSSRWTFVAPAELLSSPVLGPDCTIFVGAASGKFYSIGSDGKKRWEFASGGALRGSGAIGTDGNLFFGSGDGKVYALDPEGTKLWDLTLAGQTTLPGAILSSPTIGPNKTLYVGVQRESFYAVYAGTTPASEFWPVLGQNPQHTGRRPDLLTWLGRSTNEIPVSAGSDLTLDPQLISRRFLASIELLEGTNVLVSAVAPKLSITWTNIGAGDHDLFLRGMDDSGCIYLSAPIHLRATTNLPSTTLAIVSIDSQRRLTLKITASESSQFKVQYSSDLGEWKTAPALLPPGEWMDQGPPETDASPINAPRRFYRVVRESTPQRQ